MHDNQGAAWEAIPPAPQEPGLVGNRPANRARQATPGVLSQGWQAREGAVDFLGLDQELGASPAPTDPAPILEGTPGEGSWLLDAAEDPSEMAIEPPAPEEEPDEAEAEGELDEFVPAPPIQASWVEAQRSSGKRKVALRAAAVLALGAVGFTGWQVLGSSAKDGARTPLAPESNPTPRYRPALALESGPGDTVARGRVTAATEPQRMAPEPEIDVPRAREPVGIPLAQGPAPVWVDTERLEPPPEADVLREAFGGGEAGMLPPDPSEQALKVLDWGDSSGALEPSSESMTAVADAQSGTQALAEPSPAQSPASDAVPALDSVPAGGATAMEPASELAAAEAGGGDPVAPPTTQLEPVQPVTGEVTAATEPAPSAPGADEGSAVAAVESEPLGVAGGGEIVSPVEPPAQIAQAAPGGDGDSASATAPGSSATSLLGREALSAIMMGPMPAAPSSAQGKTEGAGAPASGFEQLLTLAGTRASDAPDAPPLGQGGIGPAAPPEASGTEGSREPAQAPSALARVGRAERMSRLSTEDVLEPTGSGVSLQLATQQDLSSVWTRGAIPFDAIGSPTKVLTPMVGKVRLVLKTKEIFEGRLYAVGEGHVWIDTQYGRMGLPGARVDRIEQIEGGPGTPALGAPGSQALVGLERVRVKTPGGVFYGKVISKDESKTTLVTDQGARITLDSKDVEYLSDVPKITLKTGEK